MATALQGLPPAPSEPAPLQALRWTFRPAPFMRDCTRRFGDAFTVGFAPAGPIVFISDPDAIKQVYTGSPELLRAGEARVLVEPLVGKHSVLLLDGAPHMRQRKLMLPAFHGERMKAYRELMTEVTERELARWPRGEPFAVWPSMQAITLDVIIQAVFGFEQGERYDRLRAALLHLLTATQSPFVIFLVLTLNSLLGAERIVGGTSFAKALRAVDELLFEEIRARRRDGGFDERSDVLSMLMAARDEQGTGLGDQELRDELITLLVAGHETTATTLAWTFERLVRHPQVLERLTAEIEAGGGHDYLDAVIKEALRLRPVLPITPRRLTGDMELLGYTMPEGTIVAPCIWLVHRREEIYPEPERFRPERFLEQPAGTYTWIPFGGGVRRCLGASFALFESEVVLATILREVRIRAAEPASERVRRRSITFVPEHGAKIVAAA